MVGSDFVSRYRQGVTALLTAFEGLGALRRQWDALDLGNALDPGDFAGANADIDLAALTAAVSSVAALETTLGQGHNTNLYAVKV